MQQSVWNGKEVNVSEFFEDPNENASEQKFSKYSEHLNRS